MKTRKPSAIPVGSQFTPSLIDLQAFISAIITYSGNKALIEDAVWQPSVRVKQKSSTPSRRNRSLPVEAAVQYGLLDRSYQATDLARQLNSMSRQEMHEAFARHILLNLGGLRVIEATHQMNADGIPITGDSLAQFLSDQGFIVGIHNTAINSLRLWLAEVDIFPKFGNRIWEPDSVRREEILPLSDHQVSILASQKPVVHAFVRALCRANPSGWVRASTIRDAAEAKEGIKIPRVSLPKEILIPLKEAGLIAFRTKGTQGGKSAELKTTPRFRREILEPFVTSTVQVLDASISDYYRRRPEDVFADLTSQDTFTKGRALEALTILIMRQLGLRFLHWNKRARDSTAQAEVDVVLAGLIGLLQSRWQVQCKNKPNTNVDVGDVAKEVGLVSITQASHILMVSTSGFTDDAIGFAREIMKRTPLTIFMLDKRHLALIRKNSALLPTILRAQSEDNARLQPRSSMFAIT